MTNKAKFSYRQKVRVIDGFMRGYRGVVMEHDPDVDMYLVRIGVGWFTRQYWRLNAANLESE